MKQILLFFLVVPFINLSSQEIPLAYIQYFDAKISQGISNQFETSTFSDVRIKNKEIHIADTPDSNNTEVPKATLLIKNVIFGDLITEIKAMVSGTDADTLSGLYIISGKRDESNFYFFLINDGGIRLYKNYRGEISLIESDSSFTIKKDIWQTLIVKRDILSRDITIKFNGSSAVFNDPNLVMGKLGVGVSDYRLSVKKFTVWAPTAITNENE